MNNHPSQILSSLVLAMVGISFAQPAFSVTAQLPPSAYDFWIGETGPVGPLFTGPKQYPFICSTVDNKLGQPIADNQKGEGNAVFPEKDGIPVFTAKPVGYSRNCSIATRVDYFYFHKKDRKFRPLRNPGNVPADVDTIEVNNRKAPFVVRVERGTINRFIYSIAMPAPYPESLGSPDTLDKTAWNGKLVYKFQGGVGIGHWQGNHNLGKKQALYYQALKRGYAVAYSTGTRTGTHYNLKIAEETALMVKNHFMVIYGAPDVTIGIGASGGAIQQYVIGQSTNRVIDAAITQMSYPDMITQAIYVADCDLLERYFDEEYTHDNSSRWASWPERSLIEGLVAQGKAKKKPWSKNPYAPSPGSSECVNAWRGQVPKLFNPAWTYPEYIKALERYRYPQEVIASIKWTHWNDLENIYPKDDNGIAYNTWDNVGIQYGLKALLDGDINPNEFLEINSCIGGWKPSQEMSLGNFPWNYNGDKKNIDPWDKYNMHLSTSCRSGKPALRTEGHQASMTAAYQAGQVFTGKLTIPVIDLRWYLEPVLNMHHAQASFAARARLRKYQGHSENQIIWVVECNRLNRVNLKSKCNYDATGNALDLIDQLLQNLLKNDGGDGIKNKPEGVVDTCFAANGTVMHTGPHVWDGILDDKAPGPCTRAFPIYPTSRMVAGGGPAGDVFKCALEPVEAALARGVYEGVRFTDTQLEWLKKIFPTGVCDFRQPDVARPD